MQVLKLAHDDLGHSDPTRTYMLFRRQYYWKGLKVSVNIASNNALLVKRETYK